MRRPTEGLEIKAAQRDTFIFALVAGFLIELSSDEADARRLERKARELRAPLCVHCRRSSAASVGGRARQMTDPRFSRCEDSTLLHQPRSDRDHQA